MVNRADKKHSGKRTCKKAVLFPQIGTGMSLYDSPQAAPSEILKDSDSRTFSVLLNLIEKATGRLIHFHDLSGVTYLVHELMLDAPQRQHNGAVCLKQKSQPGGFTVCMRCKRIANYQASRRKGGFLAVCPFGVIDWVHPVFLDGKLLGVFYFGTDSPASPSKRGRRSVPRAIKEEYDEARAWIAVAEAFLLNSARARQITPMSLPSQGGNTGNWLVKATVDFIKAHFSNDLSLSDIARHLHVRPQYLSKMFSKEKGMSLTRYLHRYRVEQARHLLLHSKFNVTEIAQRVGFGDPCYFTRIFRAHTGVSPRAYREACRKIKSNQE